MKGRPSSVPLPPAEEVVLEGALVRMSAAGFAAFRAAIAAPAVPVPAMVTLLRRTPPWERGGGD